MTYFDDERWGQGCLVRLFVEASFPSYFPIPRGLLLRRQSVAMPVLVLASPSADFETIPASSAYNMPHTALRTHANGVSDYHIFLEVNYFPHNVFVLAEAHYNDV